MKMIRRFKSIENDSTIMRGNGKKLDNRKKGVVFQVWIKSGGSGGGGARTARDTCWL